MHNDKLIEYVTNHFRLDLAGIHGLSHWQRVWRNGQDIATREGARLDVVYLFSFLHDHERDDDNQDPLHGYRAVVNAHKLRGNLFDIDDAGFALLIEAIDGHSFGMTTGKDITVLTCWDADRLDLGRVGIIPNPRYLCTNTAKDDMFLAEAHRRSTNPIF